MADAPAPVDVFISHAFADEAHRAALERHLAGLTGEQAIHLWDRAQLEAGQASDSVAAARLAGARVVLLLVSADYIDAQRAEMEAAIARHRSGAARVIPVLVRPCDWEHTPLGDLPPLPSDRRAVTSWSSEDAGWTDVARGVRAAVEELRGATRGVPARHAKTGREATAVRPPEWSALDSATELRAEIRRQGTIGALITAGSTTPLVGFLILCQLRSTLRGPIWGCFVIAFLLNVQSLASGPDDMRRLVDAGAHLRRKDVFRVHAVYFMQIVARCAAVLVAAITTRVDLFCATLAIARIPILVPMRRAFARRSGYREPDSPRALACIWYNSRPHWLRSTATTGMLAATACMSWMDILSPWPIVGALAALHISSEWVIDRWREQRDRRYVELAASSGG
ncbi:MAG: toll/interleukin-1 receptor domain-containing protein [Polyangiaceae bacterium]|nr:toll/interleukin-1 receptor domain-containing protein [Polyangiaceae bacterium]